MPLVRGFVILILIFGAVAGQSRPSSMKAARMVKVEETRYSMGCLYSITAWGEEGPGLKLAIAAALDDAELADFAALAVELGLDVLIEVHDEVELGVRPVRPICIDVGQ
jgi:hypothetical protein